MNLLIKNIQYHPNEGPVSVYLEHDNANNPRFRDYVSLTQAELTEHAGGGIWTDSDVLALVQDRIAITSVTEGIDYVVAFPLAPLFPAEPGGDAPPE